MSGFFSKLFGGKKKDAAGRETAADLVDDVMAGLIEKAGLDLQFDIRSSMNGDFEEITVEVSGADEELLLEREGALLDAFQLFAKRMLQHQLPEARVNVSFDCNGYRDESSKALIELAERLKEKALDQGRSVYVRALPPKDRKVVHQYLANDSRVKSRSVGDGLYKKIKIYPTKQSASSSGDGFADDEVQDTV